MVRVGIWCANTVDSGGRLNTVVGNAPSTPLLYQKNQVAPGGFYLLTLKGNW